jgi:twitching motility protein PilI
MAKGKRTGMVQGQTKQPILILREIEERSRNKAAPLPQQQDIAEEWVGIGFRVMDFQLLAPLGEVIEILPMPKLSRVPGVKPWVLGIANVRGTLLPVMDLAGFLHGKRTHLTKRSRVLVLNQEGVVAGLLVDEVLGLRHFEKESRLNRMPSPDMVILPYLECAYQDEEQYWGVFSMNRLAQSPLFMQVAV